jgi:hypothetical protein
MITGADVALIITALSTLLGVLGGILVQIRGQNEARSDRLALAKKFDLQSETVKKLELNTNSIKDALVASTASASEAKGHAEGLQQGRDEQKQNP